MPKSFTIETGQGRDSYLITLADGTVLVADIRSLRVLDAENDVVDGIIDPRSLIDTSSSDEIAQFVSGSGQSFTVTYGAGFDDYLITLADGTVIAADFRSLSSLDSEDGTSDGTIDVDQLIDATSADNIAAFVSGTGQSFTVTSRGDANNDDDYYINLADGSVIVINSASLSGLDSEDGAFNGVIDVDTLIDSDSSDGVVVFNSSSGQAFTVDPGSNSGDYIITLADGTVIAAGNRSLAALDSEDGTSDGQVDVDNLIDGTSSDAIVAFTSGSGQSFTVNAAGGSTSDGDYLMPWPMAQ